MLSISVRESGSALHGVYQKLMAGRWEPIEWERFELGELPAEVVAASVEAWRARLLDEYRSATLFSQFQSLTLWANVPNDLLGCCSRVVQDELRHVQLCGDLIHALGAAPTTQAPPEVFVAPWDARVPMDRQVLEFALQFFCLGEQLSARMIEATHQTTGHPMAREVLRRLGSDERFHAEFGWTVVNTVWPFASEETRGAIAADLPTQLLRLENTFVAYGKDAPDVPLSDAHRHLGSLSIGEHRDTFYAGVEQDLLPRLEALGLEARRAWAARDATSEG